MATILTKKKDTSGAPSAGDLTNSSGGAELAVNTADKRLYTKDSGGNVVEVGINPTSITTGTLNTSGQVVFNDAGADVDFRVEGDTEANLLFVDASTDRVGIGTGSPSSHLHINQPDGNPATITISNTNGTAKVEADDDFLNLYADSHRFLNEAGTSNYMVIDSSGNVGIGNDNTGSTLVYKNFTTAHQVASRGASINFGMNDGSFTGMSVANEASSNPSYNAQFITFSTHLGGISTGERMRITSGGVLLCGFSSPGNAVAGVIGATGFNVKAGQSGGLGGSMFNINWTGSPQLWIDTTNVGTLATTSDYRTKRNIATQEQAALDRITQLRPVTYQRANYGTLFQADEVVREGFIAHELAEIIPSAVEGEKDAEGQIQSLKLDALCSVMVKAIQELKAVTDTQAQTIVALEARIVALETGA